MIKFCLILKGFVFSLNLTFSLGGFLGWLLCGDEEFV